jgi:hypothetical protein
LRQQVAAVLDSLIGSGKAVVVDKSPAGGGERDIRAEVDAAVRAAKTQEERDSLVATLAGDVGKLKEQAEKAPRQIRRVEKLMGWHRGDE